MNWLKKLLVKAGIRKLKPHEKAALGLGVWGRQPEATLEPSMAAKTRGKATMSYRVYRAATDTWEDVKEVK